MKRDISLDIIRVVSCIMVFGVHLGQNITIPGGMGVFFEKGSTGVVFFFIISGLLACYSLDREYMRASGLKAVSTFWINRLVRLLPLYYFLLLFYMIIHSVCGTVPADDSGLYWIRYILFINLWVPTEVEFWSNLGALWSISVFLFFYLIAPIYYKLVKNIYLSGVIVLLAYGLMKVINNLNIGRNPLGYMFYFFLGGLIYSSVINKKQFVFVLIVSGLELFCILTGGGTAIVPALLLALFIMCTRNMEMPDMTNTILGRVVFFFSSISFGIYLVHPAVLTVLNLVNIDNDVVFAIVLIGFTVLLSTLLHELIEEKLGNLLRKRLLALVR